MKKKHRIFAGTNYENELVRRAEIELKNRVENFIAAGDVDALAYRPHVPMAMRCLLAKLPQYYGSQLVGDIYSAGHALPIRLLHGFGIVPQHRAMLLPETLAKIRNVPDRKGEVIRALIGHDGDPHAKLLRTVLERVRGVPFPTFDITVDGTPDEKTTRWRESAARSAAIREDRRKREAEA